MRASTPKMLESNELVHCRAHLRYVRILDGCASGGQFALASLAVGVQRCEPPHGLGKPAEIDRLGEVFVDSEEPMRFRAVALMRVERGHENDFLRVAVRFLDH